jgi:hypothetical protein
MGSLAIAATLVLLSYIPLVSRLKSRSGGRLSGGQKVGFGGAIAASLVLMVPAAWLLVQEVIGDVVARTHGTVEKITVVATKTDAYRRRGCTRRLRGAALGRYICLTHEDYNRLPSEVTVALNICRGTLGYHVDTQTIER